MRLANGPELWDALLKGVPHGSIIAGGAVRDFLLGVKPKDVDIFVPDTPDNREAVAEHWCDLELEDDEKGKGAAYTAVKDVAHVFHGHKFGHVVDVVMMRNFDAPKMVAAFDFAIVRSWYDGVLHDSVEAQLDRHFKSVTMLSDRTRDRSRTRFKRFEARHPEFKLRELRA